MNLKNTEIKTWTPATYTYVENEMKKYKVPFLYKIVFGSLYKYGGVFFISIFLLLGVLFMIYNSTNMNYDMFPLLKGIILTIIIGLGSLVIIAFIWHRIKVLKTCKNIGITLNQWNQMAILTGISYIK
jgi:hypothetical protein